MPKKESARRVQQHRELQQAAGIKRKEVLLDEITHNTLIDLVGKCGYNTDSKRIGTGITGVLAQAISRMSDNFDKLSNPQLTQQKTLLIYEAIILLNDGHDFADIADIFNFKRSLRHRCPNPLNKSDEWTEKSICEIVESYIAKNDIPSPFTMRSGKEFKLTKKEIQAAIDNYKSSQRNQAKKIQHTTTGKVVFVEEIKPITTAEVVFVEEIK